MRERIVPEQERQYRVEREIHEYEQPTTTEKIVKEVEYTTTTRPVEEKVEVVRKVIKPAPRIVEVCVLWFMLLVDDGLGNRKSTLIGNNWE